MRFPVLMYHKVSENKSDALTVTTQQLEEQMRYVISKGYQFVSSEDLLFYMENKKPLPLKPILISFDDAHISFVQSALPILKKFAAHKVILFIASGLVGTNHPDCGEIMSVEQIKNLDFNFVEPALHSHLHQNYKFLSLEEIDLDLKKNAEFFRENKIPVSPFFAYPYGGFPRDKNKFQQLKELFLKNNIKAAFRIGNRINRISHNLDYFQMNRIDVRGTDSFLKFKLKINFGKIL